MRGKRRIAALCAAALMGTPALAHDFWIEPSTFTPDVPASVSVSLRVGEGFEGRGVRRQASSIRTFASVGPNGRADVAGLEGREPAGFLRVDAAGDYLVGYETLGQRIELAPDRFESYLIHEGLEHVVEKRRAQGDEGKPGRERFFRCAKSLLRAGAAPHSIAGDPLGLTLEIILDADPASIAVGGELPARVLFRGEPLADLRVVGARRGHAESPFRGRTDAAGRLAVPLDAGEWLLKAVHMVAAADGGDVDWESYWASLTFLAPEPAEVAA